MGSSERSTYTWQIIFLEFRNPQRFRSARFQKQTSNVIRRTFAANIVVIFELEFGRSARQQRSFGLNEIIYLIANKINVNRFCLWEARVLLENYFQPALCYNFVLILIKTERKLKLRREIIRIDLLKHKYTNILFHLLIISLLYITLPRFIYTSLQIFISNK